MTERAIVGWIRFGMAVVAGYLLGGWRGAVAGGLIFNIVVGLMSDYTENLVNIARFFKPLVEKAKGQ